MLMTNSLTLYIASRYIRSSNYNPFAKLIRNLSIAGIATGVTVLIVISSIFNGFHEKIAKSINQLSPHIVITHTNHWWDDWEKSAHTIQHTDNITKVTPKIRTYGIIAASKQIPPIQILADYHDKKLATAQDQATPLIMDASISGDLQAELWLQEDDTLSILTTNNASLDDPQPIAIRTKIKSIQENNGQYLDARSITVDAQVLTKHLKLEPKMITELDIETTDIMQVEKTISILRDQLPDELTVINSSAKFTSLLASLSMQRKMMIIVLSFVVVIAAFNLITSLVMIVTERKKEIALLQTMGMNKRQILHIFIIQSIILASMGIIIGTLIGTVIAMNISQAIAMTEQWLGQKIISDQVWMLNHLPSVVKSSDLVIIAISTQCLAILSALYPAHLASRVEPAEVLRYE